MVLKLYKYKFHITIQNLISASENVALFNRCEKTCNTGTARFSWLSGWPQTKSHSYQRSMQCSLNSRKFS